MSSSPHSRTRRRALPLLLTAAVALAGCAAPEPTLPHWPAPDSQPGAALPVGAQYVQPGVDESAESQDREPYGSIRPDSSTVAERVPAIIERGRLIVGVAQSLNRLGFRDPVTGDLAGFEVDLAREIARDIFGDPSKVEYRYVESREREDALRKGDVDMVIRTMSITRTRQESVEFSTPYLRVNPRLLVLDDSDINGFDDLGDKTVCMARDSTSVLQVQRLHVGRVMETRTWTDCLMAMQRFQVDAVYTDDAILSGLQAQDPYTTLAGEYGEDSYYAVAMAPPGYPRDTRGLVMQVNETLERIRSDGTWDDLYEKWMAEYLGEPSPLPIKYRSQAESEALDDQREKVMDNDR